MSTQTQPRDRYVTTNGLKLHYVEWGTEGSTPMVMLHGLRGHGHSWDAFCGPMSRDYHILALDQRGRSESDWAPDADYTTDAYVSDLAGIFETLKLSPAVLVGHSMGGRVTMAFTDRYPERVQKVIIVDIPPAHAPNMERIRAEIVGAPEEFDTFEDAMVHQRAENLRPTDEVLRRRVKHQTKELPNGKIGWSYDSIIRERIRLAGEGSAAEDLWPAWERIGCPTLILRADETDALTNEQAQRMLEVNKNAQLVRIHNAGHMMFEDNPEDFLSAVKAWLAPH